MSLGDRLKELRNKQNLTQQELAKKIGCSHQSISKYEGDENMEKIKVIKNLSEFFGVSTDYLIKGIQSDSLGELSVDEEKFLSKYRNLTPHDKQIVDYVLNMEAEAPSKIYRFPVYEQQAAAGAGITGRDGKFFMHDIFVTDIPQNAVFGVHIKGNSMVNTNPKLKIEDIPDGSIVLLNSKVDELDLNKTIVVASINNEVICKYFLVEQDCIHFYSLNRKEHEGDDRFAKSPDEYRIIGQVVKIVKPDEFE